MLNSMAFAPPKAFLVNLHYLCSTWGYMQYGVHFNSLQVCCQFNLKKNLHPSQQCWLKILRVRNSLPSASPASSVVFERKETQPNVQGFTYLVCFFLCLIKTGVRSSTFVVAWLLPLLPSSFSTYMARRLVTRGLKLRWRKTVRDGMMLQKDEKQEEVANKKFLQNV